jgi:hypothetical protein
MNTVCFILQSQERKKICILWILESTNTRYKDTQVTNIEVGRFRKTHLAKLYNALDGAIKDYAKAESNKKHMHAEAIHAYAEGQKLEFRVTPGATHYGSTNDWFPCDNPDFHPNFEYRVRKDNVSS